MCKRRILPDQLKQTYERTKVVPAQECFLEHETSDHPEDSGEVPPGVCGCGLGVTLLELRPDLPLLDMGSEEIEKVAIEEFGAEYEAGYVNAFDGEDFYASSLFRHPEYKQGYLDGEACRIAIFNEPPTLLGKPIEPGPTLTDLIGDDE